MKQGHAGALALFGAGAKPEIRIERVRSLSRRVRVGDSVSFEFRLVSTARKRQLLVVDTRVHFVKANGKTRPKVFKLKQFELGSGDSVELRGRVSLAPLTTRRHYPGRHALELLVNGVTVPLAAFRVHE